MNLTELQRKLTAAARAQAPGARVPYAFEKRIMARLAACPGPDTLSLWAQALWRAAVPCVAVVILLGVTSFFVPSGTTKTTVETVSSSNTDNSLDLENTLLATVDQKVQNEEVW